jgi:hypothetical protein
MNKLMRMREDENGREREGENLMRFKMRVINEMIKVLQAQGRQILKQNSKPHRKTHSCTVFNPSIKQPTKLKLQ